jgi:replication factor C subunit 1
VQELSGEKGFSFGKSSAILMDTIPEVAEPREAKKSIITTTDGKKIEVETEMWTEKYKPRGFSDLIGNQGCIECLYTWLKDWDEVILRGNKKSSNWKGNWADAPNLNARATLLSGPPGIGKTSSARIVCA